jgi:hypothetical protein
MPAIAGMQALSMTQAMLKFQQQATARRQQQQDRNSRNTSNSKNESNNRTTNKTPTSYREGNYSRNIINIRDIGSRDNRNIMDGNSIRTSRISMKVSKSREASNMQQGLYQRQGQ